MTHKFAIAMVMMMLGGMAQAAPMAGAFTARPQQPAQDEVQVSYSEDGLRAWIAHFRRKALAAGISPAVYDAAFADVHLNATVIDKDAHQAEFTKTIWDYLDKAVSDDRVRNGRAALRDHRRLIGQIENTYGVDGQVVLAIWGLESAYGTFMGDIPVIESLATLAYEGRRQSFFEAQLIDALRILQHGDVKLRDFRGSWAGAMGHTQFIPSSYQAFAVDFDGDGRRDIWADDPGDALASTAAYLHRNGWRRGEPWGVEVTLPATFDYAQSSERVVKSSAEWAALGVRPANGGTLPAGAATSVLLPAGARGAAFLIYPNFHVIETYNAADSYVIAVGHLGDRIMGAGPLHAHWPREDRALTLAERIELQERLTAAGHDTGGSDGRIGPRTLAAVRAFQRAQGMIPDGYASLDLLKRLR